MNAVALLRKESNTLSLGQNIFVTSKNTLIVYVASELSEISVPTDNQS